MRVALLWHFHQPIYRKPGTVEFVLPWVNYHLKNYHQMIRLAAETGYPCTFNLVPCLLEQIRDYSEGRAFDPVQAALEKNPDTLTEADLTLLMPFVPGETNRVKIQEKALRRFLSPVEDLPATREGLLEKQQSVLHGLLPEFRRIGREGRAELTTTPYYHPLTPLIFDLKAAFEHILPRESFHHPDDGRRHLEKARTCFQDIFGFPPAGLWPSEGAVSNAVTKAAAKAGFPFAVTDENVLWKSLRVTAWPELLHTPYLSEGLPIFFRDQTLSDLIGFEYNRWNPEDAAADLVRRIVERKTNRPDDALVLALDGENPWDAYAENGVPFLRSFYERMLRTDGIRPAFFGDILRERRDVPREIDLIPGTWLGSFAKWIGDPAKNEGWDILSRAREACGPIEEILIAEGSDWFWWRGEAHPEFEVLFLEYIAAAYRAKGLPVPADDCPGGGNG